MPLSKENIEKLYCKEKLSTIEIGKKLRVSPWVILRFMRKTKIPLRTIRDANLNLYDRKQPSFSFKQNLSSGERELMVAGIMLYWAEGGKSLGKYCTVDMANSDPEMIRVFLDFLRKICGISEGKLRVQLYCYANQDIEKLKNFWYKVTRIPKRQFIKPYIRKDFKPEQKNKMLNGLIHVRYCDKKLLLKIEELIKEFCKNN